jgi:hypothetical protein
MAKCIKCGKWAGIGKTQHDDCEERDYQPSPAGTEATAEEKMLLNLAPVIRKSVFQGVLLAGLVFIGIGIVIGIIVAEASAH